MFDVPPPFEGVRGIDAYRETWPAFFEWQAQGAVFDIESLDVVVGGDVAYAYALLHCGTPREFAELPENRLRLTLGLRKEDGRWVVAHEHHSFPDTSSGDEASTNPPAEREVRDVHQYWFDRTAAKDLDGLMSHIAPDIVSYEHDEPLQYVGRDEVREVCKRGLEATAGSVGWEVPGLKVLVRGDVAVAWGLNRMEAQAPDGTLEVSWSRGTRVFRRSDGDWEMVHQHVSYPYDPETGEARTDLEPDLATTSPAPTDQPSRAT
jgi:ketosteroid isomerase-like protein